MRALKCRKRGWGSIAQLLAYSPPYLAAPDSIPSIPVIFSEEKIVNIVEVNQQCCLEESGQWLENVYRTRLVLAKWQASTTRNAGN